VPAFEELVAAMGQMACEQLTVGWRNDGIVSASENEHGSRDGGKQCLEAREIARVGSDKFSGFGKPATGGREPVVFENRRRRRDSRRLRDELHGDGATFDIV
jgi:hypothetical protein